MLNIGTKENGSAFKLPLDLVTQTQAILANKGRGKTYLGMVQTEEMLASGSQVVVLDPTGVWWGLQADGKGAGYPVLVMGGEHGNVPLEPSSGEVVADFLIDSGQSAVLDLSTFESGAAQDRFVTALAERIYRRKASNRSPLHMMLDEADSFAPQRPQKGQERMLGAFEAIVRRGRSRGLGITMITQRPAVLNKNVLELIELLTCLGIVGPLDQDAVANWVKRHDPGRCKEFIDSLASLPKGTAWFWSPEWLGIFERVKVREKLTFDSSKTPEAGAEPSKPKGIAEVNLTSLTEQIKASVEQAKANDPRALRHRITELEKQIAAKPKPTEVKTERVEIPVLKEGQIDRLQKIATSLLNIGGTISNSLNAIVNAPKAAQPPPPPRTFFLNDTHTQHVQKRHRQVATAITGAAIGKGERIILIAVAQHAAGCTREQLTVLTGYKRSSRDTYLQRLFSAGLVHANSDSIVATREGIASLGSNFEPLPTGEGLRDHWMRRLGGGEQKLFGVIVDAYPHTVTRESLSESTGYMRSSRDTYLQRLQSRKLVESLGGGEVRASAELFD